MTRSGRLGDKLPSNSIKTKGELNAGSGTSTVLDVSCGKSPTWLHSSGKVVAEESLHAMQLPEHLSDFSFIQPLNGRSQARCSGGQKKPEQNSSY